MLAQTENSAPSSTFLDNFDRTESNLEEKISEYFGRDKIINRKQSVFEGESIFICFTNRCGSNFLADVLQNTGLFPEAGEFFNLDAVVNFSQRNNITSFDDYCSELARRKAKNKTFISKIGCEQLLMLSKLGQIPNIFNNSKFIWIRRQDILGQAISLSIASRTKQWTSKQTGNGVTPDYNKEQIQKIIKNINKINTNFATYFNLFNASYIEVVYEDFCLNPKVAIEKICNFTGKTLQFEEFPEAELKVQRNSINDDFRAKFLADMGQEFSLTIRP
jgi:trehalose 2-sulfotransferase